MAHFILGRKGRMTQVFTEEGVCIPVTILEAGPCTVTQVKTADGVDRYNAVQLAYEPVKNTRKDSDKEKDVLTKPMRGHFGKAGVDPHRFLREARLEEAPAMEVGSVIKCDVFAAGNFVDITGTTKGRGFAGTIKRHGFARRPATHGHMRTRRPGAIGMHSDPSRVFKGKRMSGRFGGSAHTVKNLEVVKVDAENNIILVKGAVPGPRGGFVMVRTAKTGIAKEAS